MRVGRFVIFILSLVIVFSFSFSVYAVDIDENTVTDDNSIVDDDSMSDQVSDFSLALTETNSILNVIQSQIWIILVVGLIYFVYKFFRIFF